MGVLHPESSVPGRRGEEPAERDVVVRARREQIARDIDEEASVREIVRGITQDARDFVNLQIEVLKLDVRQEIADAKVAAAAGLGGAAVLGLGALILLMATAELLAYTTALPVWGGYAIVGLAVVVGGAGLLSLARARQKRMKIVPPALREAKEDIAWIKESTSA